MLVGMTGNMGSGKSFVCQFFSVLGIPIYHSDERAKQLLVEDPELVEAVKQLLGPEAYSSLGVLNREYIANKVFANKELLLQYNGIIHPAVRRDAEKWHRNHVAAPYTIQDAALIFESGNYKHLDFIICVTAPLKTRIARIKNRDGIDEATAMRRIENQWPEEKKVEKSNAVIINDGVAPVIPQVWNLYHQLLAL
jgi:dephospho-CoA kinase